MTVGDYLFFSVLGICVVFFALILLMAIIKVMSIASRTADGEPLDVSADETDPEEAGRPLAPGTAGEVKLNGTDPRDAAMVMAIVADELQKPLNELRFTSIREISDHPEGVPLGMAERSR